MNETASHKNRGAGKACRCAQCRRVDEAFGLTDTDAIDDVFAEEEMEAKRRPAPSGKRCPCEANADECRDAREDEAVGLDWAGLDVEDDSEDLDEDRREEAEEEAAELEDLDDADDRELAAMLAGMEDMDVDLEATLSDDEAFDADDDDEDSEADDDMDDDLDEAMDDDEDADEEDVDFEELMTDSSFGLPNLQAEEDDMEVRHVRPGCPGVRRISIRKGRDGSEPFANQAELCIAATLALRQATRAWEVIQSVWQARGTRRKRARWRSNPELVRWFGSRILTRRQMRVTRRRLRRIMRAMQRGVWFVVVQEETGRRSWGCDGDALAYSYGSSRVFLCPSYFGGGRSAEAQARTIIHEQVHRLGWAHPLLPGRGAVSSSEGDRALALELARVKPMRARRSPVNIAWFMSSV